MPDSSNLTAELPRPAWMSKKDREYLQRLMVRKGLLDIRLASTQLRDTQEITKELHALEWAIERLSTPVSESAQRMPPEANELAADIADARRFRAMLKDPVGARHLLHLLQQAKGDEAAFRSMIDRIDASREAANARR
jgi:hypothetical protein